MKLEMVLQAAIAQMHLHLREGDYLVVRPGAEMPVMAFRSLPANYGAIAGALGAGQLTAVSPESSAALAELTRLASQQPASTSPAKKRRVKVPTGPVLLRLV